MNNIATPSGDTNFGLDPVLHRWDTWNGMRVITFFNRKHVLGVVSEVEHLIMAECLGWSAAVKVAYLPAPIDAYTQTRWDALPDNTRKLAEARRRSVSAIEVVQTIKDGTPGQSIVKRVEARLGRLTVQRSGLIEPLLSS